jgi:hypothetical protein
MTIKTHEFTITGRITAGGSGKTVTASAATQTGTGNGTIGTITVDQTKAVAETITVTATSTTSFTAVGSVSGAQGTVTVGAAFVGKSVGFKITAGSTAFVAGDKFVFTLTSVDAFPFSGHTLVIDEVNIDGVEQAVSKLDSASLTAAATAAKTVIGKAKGLI